VPFIEFVPLLVFLVEVRVVDGFESALLVFFGRRAGFGVDVLAVFVAVLVPLEVVAESGEDVAFLGLFGQPLAILIILIHSTDIL
jgi:hypothetical protein